MTLDAALRLIEERNWYVYPCEPGAKRPAYHATEFPHGFLGATNDPERVRAVWAPFGPGAGLGIATERSGLAVVDVDAQHGGLETLARLRAERVFAPTLAERTPNGGWHFYYAAPAGEAVPSKPVPGLPGIEMRAGASCVTCSPTVLRGCGRYEWLDAAADVAPLPERIAVLARPVPRVVPSAPPPLRCMDAYVRRAVEGEIAAVRADAGGSDDSQLNTSAFSLGTLVGAGVLSAEEATAALLHAALAAGKGERAARGTIRRGLRAGIAKPRVVRPRRAS